MYRNFAICVRHTPCPVGQGVVRKGSYRRNTICQTCPLGTFSKRSSLFEKCKPWTNCTAFGLKTREDGNASKDAKCGDRLQPQLQQPTPPTSGPAHNTPRSASMPMITHTAAATVSQNNSHGGATTSSATLSSTTVGSAAVTPTPTSSQTTPGSGESTTTGELSSGEDRHPGPDNQPAIAVSDVVVIIISLIILVLLIIVVFIVWYYNKKKGEPENIADHDQPGAVPPHHQQLPIVPGQGGDLNPQDLQEQNEHQALLPGMEQGDQRELEPDAIQQARVEQNQQVVQISGAVGTGAPGAQQLNLGVYQDHRCLYDARQHTVQLQIQHATVHQSINFGNPEFVQIGPSNTINQGANAVDTTNPESTNSDVTG